MLLVVQRTAVMYSRWYLIFEIIVTVLLLIWRFRINWKKAVLLISILYESIYTLDLMLLVLTSINRDGLHIKYIQYMQFTPTGGRLLIYLVGRGVVLLAVCFLVRYRKKLLPVLLKNWKVLFVIPVIQHLTLIQCDVVFIRQMENTVTKSLFSFLVIYLCFTCFLVVFYIQKKGQYEKELLEERSRAMGQRYQELLEDNRERNIFVHDMEKHLTVLEGLFREGQTEKGLSYIGKIRQSRLLITQRVGTGNVVVDVLLDEKLSMAQKLHIKVKVMAEELADSFVEDQDWCSILANLLDNAMEACKKVERKRWINVRIGYMPLGILVCVENSCIGSNIEEVDGRPETTKDKTEGHGIGLQSVQHAVKKYGGFFSYECENDIFTANVILYR